MPLPLTHPHPPNQFPARSGLEIRPLPRFWMRAALFTALVPLLLSHSPSFCLPGSKIAFLWQIISSLHLPGEWGTARAHVSSLSRSWFLRVVFLYSTVNPFNTRDDFLTIHAYHLHWIFRILFLAAPRRYFYERRSYQIIAHRQQAGLSESRWPILDPIDPW